MIAGVFDEVFGVPTHPLAVHAPIVLVPIGAIVAVVLAVRSDWRRRISWGWPAAVFVLVVLLFVAKESGESAVEAEQRLRRHLRAPGTRRHDVRPRHRLVRPSPSP